AARLLPAAGGRVPTRGRRAGGVRRAGPGTGRGMGTAGVAPPRRPDAAAGPDHDAAQPVRPADLAPWPHRTAVRLPLPDRDLRTGAAACLRLLRPAVPARRRPGGAGGPAGGPPLRGAARARRLAGTGCRHRYGGPGARRRAAPAGRVAGAGEGGAGRTGRPGGPLVGRAVTLARYRAVP